MIPDELVEFIHGPVGLLLGTRDAHLRPSIAWVSGAVADAANDEITVFVADAYARQTLANLEDNGMAAVTCGHGPAHEAFQFKGRFIEARPSNEQDMAVQELFQSKVSAHFGEEYGEAAGKIFSGMLLRPSTAIRFKVTQIFDQTPGPNAGKLIEF